MTELKWMNSYPEKLYKILYRFKKFREKINVLINRFGYEIDYINEDQTYFTLKYVKGNYNSIDYRDEINVFVHDNYDIAFRRTVDVWSYSQSKRLIRYERDLGKFEPEFDSSEYEIVEKNEYQKIMELFSTLKVKIRRLMK